MLKVKEKIFLYVLFIIFGFYSCTTKHPSEIVFVFIDCTGSYVGFDRDAKTKVWYKDWAVEDLFMGVKNIATAEDYIFMFKKWQLVISEITGEHSSHNLLFDRIIDSESSQNIFNVLNRIKSLPMTDKPDLQTDLYSTLEFVCNYIENYMRSNNMEKVPKFRIIYYSDMINESKRTVENINTELLKKYLKGKKIFAIFCRGEEYDTRIKSTGRNRFEETKRFLEENIRTEFVFFPPPSSSSELPSKRGDSYFSKALKK